MSIKYSFGARKMFRNIDFWSNNGNIFLWLTSYDVTARKRNIERNWTIPEQIPENVGILSISQPLNNERNFENGRFRVLFDVAENGSGGNNEY